MKRASFLLLLFSVVYISCKENTQTSSPTSLNDNNVQEISFYTSDSIKIIGDLYELDKENNTILLFHQGGSNARGEYGSIIPRLTERGFNVLATDQRSGGQYYGSYNRTLANVPTHSYGDGYTYCDAYNNLESALDFAIQSGFTGKKIIWGSSYSATLAIKLASNRPDDIDGVLSFSPASGNPMKGCNPEEYLKTVTTPLLILKPPREATSETAKLQFELAEQYNHDTFVPEHGVHGSSMLVEERVGNDVEGTWNVVLSFIDKVVKD